MGARGKPNKGSKLLNYNQILETMQYLGFKVNIQDTAKVNLRAELTAKALVGKVVEHAVVSQQIAEEWLKHSEDLENAGHCENCGETGTLHKVKYVDENTIGSLYVCNSCDEFTMSVLNHTPN